MDIICTRTVIRTAKYDACRDFYARQIGWPIFTEYTNPHYRGVCFGDAVWGIEILDDPTALQDDQRSRSALEVADVWAVRADLATRIPDLPEIEDRGFAHALMVTAPDGWRVMFFTRKPRTA